MRRFIPLSILVIISACVTVAHETKSVQLKMCQTGEIYLESPPVCFNISGMSKVSIIIPVYKVEAYLAECLESVRRQTVDDFEVIMVDDGSPDGCAAICRQFEKKDARFHLLQQENGGVTAARQNGQERASGEYVMFVDGDDTLPPDAIEVLLSHMSVDVDIVVGQPDTEPLVCGQRYVDIDEHRRMLIFGKLYLAMWGKLYRRSLFDDFTFAMPREIRAGEDWIANLRLAFNTEKNVQLIPDVVYHYRPNEEGVSSTILRTVEHEKMVYEGLCASVPVEKRATYLPMVAAAYAPIWVKYTDRMICLSPVAEEFRQHILAHVSVLKTSLRCKVRLFAGCTNPVLRRVLILLSKLNGQLFGLVAGFRRI